MVLVVGEEGGDMEMKNHGTFHGDSRTLERKYHWCYPMEYDKSISTNNMILSRIGIRAFFFALLGCCFLCSAYLLAQAPSANNFILNHPLSWKYGWKDGNRANTIGSAQNKDPSPTPIGYLTPGGYTPTDIANAYGYNLIPSQGNGANQVIAIIDLYGSPNIQTDLDKFCTQFNLPKTTVHISYLGGIPTSINLGWAQETTLDVEWVHAMAPGARIELVVINPANADIAEAVNYATLTLHAKIVSMSFGFGGQDDSSVQTYCNSIFTNKNVAYVAASGDSDSEVNWPAAQTNTIGVGGTSLLYNANNKTVVSETVWNNVPIQTSGTGGGISAVQTRPSYQKVWNSNNMRGVPDVSAVADPYTGCYVFFTDPTSGSNGFSIYGGTSLSAPLWAGLLACRASLGVATITNMPAQLYAQANDVGTTNYSKSFRDIVTGNNILNGVGFSAQVGYDYCTGLGSPKANVIANPLANLPPPPILQQWGATPGPIPTSLTNANVSIKAISCGAGNRRNSAALTTAGQVVVWGSGACTNVPSSCSNGVSAISLGFNHMLAIKNGGVIAWGDNVAGQTTVPVLATNGVVAVSAGYIHSLVLTSGGYVGGWGHGYTIIQGNHHNPDQVLAAINSSILAGGRRAIGIAAGGCDTANGGTLGHTITDLVLFSDGTVQELGDSFTNAVNDGSLDVPVGLRDVVAISIGAQFALALKRDGSVVAWGDNSKGQCDVPKGLSGVVAISAGAFHALALKGDGTVVAWGDNSDGQCTIPTGLSKVKAIEAGRYHSMSSLQGVGDSQSSGGGGGSSSGGGWRIPAPPRTGAPSRSGNGNTQGNGNGATSSGGAAASRAAAAPRGVAAPRH